MEDGGRKTAMYMWRRGNRLKVLGAVPEAATMDVCTEPCIISDESRLVTALCTLHHLQANRLTVTFTALTAALTALTAPTAARPHCWESHASALSLCKTPAAHLHVLHVVSRRESSLVVYNSLAVP